MGTDSDNAYWTRSGERTFLPQRWCAGAWNVDELHIALPNGLLIHELERWLAAERGDDGKVITRVSLDYLGVIDFTECEAEFEVLRPGRSVELVEGILSQHGRPVLRARAWRVSTNDTRAVAGGERDPLPTPGEAASFDLGSIWPGDYISSVTMRAVAGPEPGRTTAWLTTPLPIIAGEPTTDLARCMLLIDTMNGIAVRRPPTEWQFPNVDLTIHLFRQPAGEWVGFDTRVVFGPDGHGLTSADLFDQRGHIGRAEQTLLVRPRA